MQESLVPAEPVKVSATGRWLVLGTAFLGWLFAGVLMSTTSLAMRSAALDLLARTGVIDGEQFQALTKAVQERPGTLAPAAALSADDGARLKDWRTAAQAWFAYYQCALLFGAAAGGLVFGRLGDRIGRVPAMAASILCYALLSAAAYFA